MKNRLLGKVASVLDFITASDHPVSMRELHEKLAIPSATLSRIAADLIELGLIEKACYRALVPGAGLFRLQYGARSNFPLYQAAAKVLSPFAAQNDLNVLLIAAEKGKMFPVFSLFLSPQSPRILWTSGAGVMMLAALETAPEEAGKLHLAANPEAGAEERVIFGQEFAAARRDGLLFRIRQLRQWTISLPFTCRGTPCVLTVFGKVPERFDNMLFETECRRLITRIITNAKEFCSNEK